MGVHECGSAGSSLAGKDIYTNNIDIQQWGWGVGGTQDIKQNIQLAASFQITTFISFPLRYP